MSVIMTLSAQSKLSISPFFAENSAYSADSKMVWVEGKELKAYHLTLYRSISTENPKTIKEMEQAVLNDSKRAADKEIGYVGARLYYAFLSLKPAPANANLSPDAANPSRKRFIFYRNASLKANNKKDATLVYMEGTVSLEELKKLFK